jgi:hypothetical protein
MLMCQIHFSLKNILLYHFSYATKIETCTVQNLRVAVPYAHALCTTASKIPSFRQTTTAPNNRNPDSLDARYIHFTGHSSDELNIPPPDRLQNPLLNLSSSH